MASFLPLKDNNLLLLKKISVFSFFCWLFILNISPLSRLVNSIYFCTSSILVVLPLFFIFYKIYKEKGFQSYDKYLLFFLLISLVSCLINFHGFPANFKRVIWTSIYILFIFSDDDLHEILESIKWMFLVFMFVSSLISIGMFFVQYKEQFYLDNQIVRIGFVENRVFGVYVDLNCAAICASICFFICLLNIHRNKSIIFTIINLIIQLAYITLSNSRACLLSLTFSFYFICFLFFYVKLKNSLFKSIVYSISSTIMLLLILRCLSYILVESVNILDFYYKVDSPRLSLDRIDIEHNEYSNGRFAIWRDASEIFKNNWMFGVSPGNITSYAKKYCKGGIIDIKNYGAMHNIEVDILVSVGLFASICFTIFLIKFANSVIKCYVEKNKNYLYDFEFNILTASALSVLISSLFMSEIAFFSTTETFLFWLFLSEIRRKMKKENV